MIKLRSVLLAGIAGAAFFASAASAQTAPAAGGFSQPPTATDGRVAEQTGLTANDGREIIVTARRRDERLQDVPLSITAVSGETLERRGVDNIYKLQQIAPALTIAPSVFGPTDPSYIIRGQRLIENLLPQDPPASIYFAEIVQQRPHGTPQSLYDLDSVQVLKGPQGTLFGRNSTGGAILIEPKKPVLGRFEGFVTGTTGNYGLYGGQAAVNVPIGSTLAIRVAGQVRYHKGYGLNLTTGIRTYDENMESFRIGAKWEPTDAISSYTMAQYLSYNDHGSSVPILGFQPGSTATAVYPGLAAALSRQLARDPLVVEHDAPLFDHTKTWLVSNSTTIELSDRFSIKNIIGYRDVINTFGGDFDGAPFPAFNSANYLDAKQFSEELQGLGELFDGRVKYIVGGYYFRESGRDLQPSRVFSPRLANRDGYAINKSYSLFAQADFKITDNLTFTGGLRQTWDKRFLDIQSRTSTAPPGTPANPVDLSFCRIQTSDTDLTPRNPCSLKLNAKFDAFTYLLSVSQKINDDVLVYATHNTGYRPGGLNLRAAKPGEGIPFQPEKVKNNEIGIKSEFLDHAIRLNLAGFIEDYTNIQRSFTRSCSTGTGLCTVIENAASARLKGFELDATARPTKWLTLGGFIGYTSAKYRRFIDSSGLNLSGRQLAQVPTTNYGFNGEVTVPLAGDSALIFAADHSYQGKQITTDTLLARKTPAYSLNNASVTWQNAFSKPLDIRAYINNIADKRYLTNAIDLLASIGTISYYVGAPRTFGASATYHF